MKVLITDDDITTRLTLRGLLSQHDCEIVEAASGLEALEVIQSDSPPNLIFMDWNMPDLSGVEVTTLLRETLSEDQPYVIIVSSYNADQQILEALSYGADDYITKPVDGNFLNAKFAVAKRIIDTQEKLKQSNEVLEKLAYYDELTGVLNRRAGNASFMVEVERCVRGDQSLSVAMVDIDYFKKVNDTYGHQTGDIVLKDFANILRKTIRPYDIVCRYGGEEFLLIAEVNSTREAQQLFERVRLAVNALKIKAGEVTITITASFGVYVVTPSTQLSLNDMVKHADQALYQAKSEGRNRVIVKSKLNDDDVPLQGTN
jgi:diguanylate cyclase (GGDEF)-like protein